MWMVRFVTFVHKDFFPDKYWQFKRNADDDDHHEQEKDIQRGSSPLEDDLSEQLLASSDSDSCSIIQASDMKFLQQTIPSTRALQKFKAQWIQA